MKKNSTKTAKGTPDGRTLRTERSRKLIIDAMLALVEEGNLIPTAQQVADRADVVIRTVFRHFSEMENLYTELDASLRDSYENLFLGGDRSGSLEERVLHAVECHANAYTKLSPIILSSSSQAWRWPVLRKNYARNQRGLRNDLDNWLPELKETSSETRDAIDAIASFEFWHRLQSHQGLSKKASITLINKLIVGLLKDS